MRRYVPAFVLALIFLFVGVASAAAIFVYVPDPGPGPSIFDDFHWDSTSNGYWHVNSYGATTQVANSRLTLNGASIELDHLLQTDPVKTIIAARVRGFHFGKFALGLGSYHGGTLSLEFDSDGIKCGYGSNFGWEVVPMKPWTSPPAGTWFYLEVAVTNPYPYYSVAQLDRLNPLTMKPVTLRCSAYDSRGHLITASTPTNPPPNAHYAGIDEAYFRTWDNGNDYQLDWVYAGPRGGIPSHLIPAGSLLR